MRKLTISLGLIALAGGAHAHAACMDNLSRLIPGSSAARTMGFQFQQPEHVARVVPIGDWGIESPGIVGLWQFKMSGFNVDWGTQAWHADGTEFMFSVGQNPATGDVCQGVWQQIGPRTYTLSHIAMGWAAPGADPTKGSEFMRVHFHMQVTLDPRGQSFSGKYSVSIFMESASDPFNENTQTNPPIASGTGAVTATRVNPEE